MNSKTTKILAALAIVSIVIVGIYSVTRTVQQQQKIEETKKEVITTITQDLSKQGLYSRYSSQLMQSNSTGTNIIIFSDPDCSGCKKLDRDIMDNFASIPASTLILKEEYSQSEIKSKYNVDKFGTIVAIKGETTKTETVENIDSLLKLVEFVNK
jgi:5S rRNA maturation endonuclease (ribonuclease M5)